MNTTRQLLTAIAQSPDEADRWLVLADYLEESGDDASQKVRGLVACKDNFSKLLELVAPIPLLLIGYDWEQAFGYCGREQAYNSGRPELALPNDADTSVEPFGRWDVKRVIAASEGENDEADWLVVGELWDGRFFALSAGCDYTGWD